MSKAEAYQQADQMGLGFIANLIVTRHRNAARKLKGLVKLAQQGHEIRTGQFDCDTLVIDGRKFDWAVLESEVLVDRWMSVAARDGQ